VIRIPRVELKGLVVHRWESLKRLEWVQVVNGSRIAVLFGISIPIRLDWFIDPVSSENGLLFSAVRVWR
jgi:hypothetical protein